MIAHVVARRRRDDTDLAFERRLGIERLAAQVDEVIRFQGSVLAFPQLCRCRVAETPWSFW